ncbi:MAG: DUF4397 domain-containing protein [Bacteriovoracaceae bacterium]
MNKLALILLFTLLGCVNQQNQKRVRSSDNGAAGENGAMSVSSPYLRAIHLSPNAPNVDVLVNNQRVISNFSYYGSSTYLPLDKNNLNIKLNPSGLSYSVISADVSLQNAYQTVIALNSVSSLEPIILVDDRNLPPFRKVKVRVGHGISTVGAVDVFVVGADNNCTSLEFQLPVIQGASFKDVSDYLTIDSGVYDICVTLAGSSSPVIIAQDLELSSQGIYTVFAINEKNDFESFGLMLLDDLGVKSPSLLGISNFNNNPNSFTLRTIHLSADAPAVDVYKDDKIIIRSLPYLASTSYVSLSEQNMNIKVKPTGSSTSVINADIVLPSKHNTIIALNDVSSLETILISDDRDAPGLGRVKVRVGHGISVVGQVDVYVLSSTNNCSSLGSQSPTLTGVSFKDISSYLEINSGTYDICITAANSTTAAIVGDDIVLPSQSNYTIFAVNARYDFESYGLIILDDLGVNSPIYSF